jgi:hypothetical protein
MLPRPGEGCPFWTSRDEPADHPSKAPPLYGVPGGLGMVSPNPGSVQERVGVSDEWLSLSGKETRTRSDNNSSRPRCLPHLFDMAPSRSQDFAPGSLSLVVIGSSRVSEKGRIARDLRETTSPAIPME